MSALTPIEQKTVTFYGDSIIAVRVGNSDDDGQRQRAIYAPLRPICEHLGLAWSSQLQRIRRDPVLSEVARTVFITNTDPTAPGDPEMIALPIEFLHGWLFGITVSRVREDLREKVVLYQKECYRVLFEAFSGKSDDGRLALQQVQALGMAVSQLAGEQLRMKDEIQMNFGALLAINKRLSDVEIAVFPPDEEE